MTITFGLVLRPDRDDVVATAQRIVTWAAERGLRAVLLAADADRVGAGEGVDAVALRDVDAVISLGGDGTILQTVALLDGAPTPVIGVNLGKLAYLADVEPDNVTGALDAFLAGEHRLEDRMLLDVVIDLDDGSVSMRALNEVVVEKTRSGQTVRVEVAIDGTPFTPYEADALIVATPTGSTAYAFSAGGPILAATLRALLVTPVSPHMLFDRSVVLEPDARIGLRVAGSLPASITVDGRSVGEVRVGGAVTATASQTVVRLARFTPTSSTGILKTKFRLSDR